MIEGVSWVDVAIFAVIALATYRGFRRGFIGELAGLVAIAAGLIAPWYYNGVLDRPIAQLTTLSVPIAHVVGMLLSGFAAYAIVLAIALLLRRIAQLPILGIGNALAGAALGFIKGAVLVWLVLFVALFFPLSPPIRASLHRSYLAPYFVAYDAPIDGAIRSAIPGLVLPWLQPLFDRHHL